MPTVSRTFSVSSPPAAVVDYLKDFTNAEQWDPGTKTCTRSDDGPVAPGASWHNVSNIFGVKAELTYVLRELTDTRLVFVGTNKSSTSTDTITVTADGKGSTLHYRADLEMNGAAKLLNPVMKLVFEKLANNTEKQMVTVLDAARERFEPAQIAVVGHSMGGRVAAHLAARGDVGAVVALAPWWVGDDGDLIPVSTRLLVIHGTADSWTDPRASRAQTRRAEQRGVDARWVGLDGAGHYMVRRWRDWHGLTADFVTEQLTAANSGS